MCYSAQIYAEFKLFQRQFGAVMDIDAYVKTFWPREKKQPRAKAPRALIRELEEIGPPELREALIAQHQADIAEQSENSYAHSAQSAPLGGNPSGHVGPNRSAPESRYAGASLPDRETMEARPDGITAVTWLSPDEVFELTARRRWTAQCRALATMGVPFRLNAVGRPLVERSAVLTKPYPKPSKKRAMPDWSALEAARGRAKH